MFDTRWFASCAAVTLSAAIQGTTGFGFALISLPLLLMLYEPRTAIVLNIVVSTVCLGFICSRASRNVSWPTLTKLAGGSLIGALGGWWVFRYVSEERLRFLALGTVLLAAIFLLLRTWASGMSAARQRASQGPEGPTPKPGTDLVGVWKSPLAGAYVLTGVLSGFLTTSVSLPGPPVIILFTLKRLPKATFRSTSAAYFILTYLTSFVLLCISEQACPSAIVLGLSFVPFALVGSAVGNRLFTFISQRLFDWIVPILLMGLAVCQLIIAARP